MKSAFQHVSKARLRSLATLRRVSAAPGFGILMLWCMLAPSVEAADLQKVDFAALPGSRVEVELTLSEPIAVPQSFATESPARIALDLPGVVSKLDSKSVPIGVGAVHSLIAVEGSNKTRVVLNLTDPVAYDVSTSGNRVIIKVDQHGSLANAAPPPVTPPPTPASASPRSVATNAQQTPPAWSYPTRSARAAISGPPVKDIDFRRGASGEGRIIIRLPSANTRVAVREQATRVYVDLYDTSLPQRLFRRLDVLDFATPVVAVESRPTGRNVEVEVQTEGDFDYMAYQTDEIFTLDFRPLTPAEKEEMARKKVVYEGDRLSLNFQDIEVRAVLQVLADFTDLNLVASDTVQGNITLRLKNVPWDQALDIILKTKGLDMRRNGNVIMVAPTQELAEQERLALESEKSFEELAPLRTEFIQINYAKASDIAQFIRGGSSSGKSSSKTTSRNTGLPAPPGVDKESILSNRGTASFDERTNTLVVMDTIAKLEGIRAIVAKLDVAVRQVMIESRVVIANNDFARDLGVRFGVSGSMGSIGGNELLIAGGQDGNLALSGFDTGPFGINTDTGTAYIPSECRISVLNYR
ncbi:Secretin/TonB short domain protein [Thiorhodococcus drewsii AZ1]|uniref:Secretin/TonB short domain protein n=1 Tax=Thiorhodococcus drewsii AZ1 TaxID=765913 RepID=G2E599_9GAMM|nr:AMIN domain-containing protein [Thiorhodococcus drewsii]EGV29023.1 Secretin/TonB short domain protein [Thiorhodococcus drewsii AZ1]